MQEKSYDAIRQNVIQRGEEFLKSISSSMQEILGISKAPSNSNDLEEYYIDVIKKFKPDLPAVKEYNEILKK